MTNYDDFTTDQLSQAVGYEVEDTPGARALAIRILITSEQKEKKEQREETAVDQFYRLQDQYNKTQAAIDASDVLTPEQKQRELQRLETVKGTSQISGFGSLNELGVPKTAASPLEQPRVFTGLYDMFSDAMLRTVSTGEVVAKEEDARYINLVKEWNDAAAGWSSKLDEADRRAFLEGANYVLTNTIEQNPNYNTQQIWDESVKTLQSMREARNITEEELAAYDDRVKQQIETPDDTSAPGLVAESLSFQREIGTELPMYSPEQFEYFKIQEEAKYSPEITAQLTKIANAQTIQERRPNTYLFNMGGGKLKKVPFEVVTYLEANPLGGIVYDAETDLTLLRKIKKSEYEIAERRIDVGTNRAAAQALARVRAYDKLGNPNWKEDQDKRKVVLDNLTEFDSKGWIRTTTATGGTADSTPYWLFRVAMSPVNAYSALAYEGVDQVVGTGMGVVAEGLEAVGVLGEADYLETGRGTRAREESLTPKYKGLGLAGRVAENIALNKGFMGEAEAVADRLNLDTAYSPYVAAAINTNIKLGGAMMDIGGEPVSDVMFGAPKALSTGMKTYKAHKALYGSKSYSEALKQAAKTGAAEVDLIQGTLSLANRVNSKIPKSIEADDLSVTLANNVADNLHATKLLEDGYDYFDLKNQGLENTFVAQLIKNENMEPQDAIRMFRQKIEENPKTLQMLKEYQETSELVYVMRGDGTPTDKALRLAKSKSELPNANVKQAKRAIDAATKEGIGYPQQNLARIYGRGMFYEIAGDTVDLDNLKWLTRKTLVTKNAQPKIMALATQSAAGKTMSKVLKFTDDTLIRTQRIGRLTSGDILGSGAKIRPTETLDAYDLTGMPQTDVDEIIDVINGLELPTTLKEDIIHNLKTERILYSDDYNEIRSGILDRIARVYKQGVTVDDINRLEGSAQQSMLEAQGTVYRDKQGRIMSALGGGARFVLDSFLNTKIGKKVTPESIQDAYKRLNTPIVEESSDMGLQMRRVLSEHNQAMATLGIRTRKTFEDLINNNANIIDDYIDSDLVPDGLDGSQAIGLMTVGERTIGVGKIEQVNNLKTSIQWLVDNLFLRKGESYPVTYNQRDRASGLITNTTPKIWNPHGEMYIQQQLDEIAEGIVDDPLTYWEEVQKLLNDLDDAIQNPANRQRKVVIETKDGKKTISRPIVEETISSKNVDSLSKTQADNKFGTIGLTTYYVAESNREMTKVLDNLLQGDFRDVNVKNITTAPISQEAFENSVQSAASIIFSNQNNMASEYTLNQRITKAVQDSQRAVAIENTATTFNVNKIDNEILRLLRADQKVFDKDVRKTAREYRKNVNANIKEELIITRKSNKKKIDTAMKEFDKDQNKIIAKDKARVLKQFDIDLARIPEANRKNKKIENINKIKQNKFDKLDAEAERTLKRIQKAEDRGTISKKTAANERDKVDNYVKIRKDQVKKKAEELILDEKNQYEKYAGDSKEVRNLKNKRNKDLEDLGKKYSKIRKEYKQTLTDKYNEELIAYKKELQDKRDEGYDQNLSPSKGKESIEQAKLDLANMTSIEEKIEYVKSKVEDLDNETIQEFDKIISAIKESELEESMLVEVTDQVTDYALTVLRNNNLSYSLTRGTVSDIEATLDNLFSKNQGFARALFGEDAYKQLQSELITKTKAQRQKILVQAIKEEGITGSESAQKVIDIANQTFYTLVLGYNMASHVRNVISAPSIVYQTTGRMVGPTYAKKGLDVVRKGGRIGSDGYGKIAVKTPDGRVYTNGDIYNMLQKAGVRSQFEFLQSEMGRKGKLIRQIEAMKDKNLSDYTESWMKRIGKKLADSSDFPLQLQTYEDMTFRSAVAIQVLEEGGSIEEASAAASRSMFNYSDLDPDVNRALRAAFIFTSFRIQNAKELIRAFNNPTKLKRYFRILKALRTTNGLFRSFNENKQLPYQAYYPQFAQTRLVYEINHYDDSVAFAMAPAIPAVDSMVELIGWTETILGPVGRAVGVDSEAKDINMFETITNQLSPLLKETLYQVTSSKYESSKAKPELVTIMQNYYGSTTPYETAQILERFCGGQVYPKQAGPNDKNAVNGWVYPLTPEQRKHLYHRSLYTVFTILGANNLIVQGVRALDPNGTTHRSLNGFQRSLAFFGLFSVSEAKSVEVQQTRRQRAITSEMKRMQSGVEDLEKLE